MTVWALIRNTFLVCAILATTAAPGSTAELRRVDLALVLAVDVSSSVDASRFKLQLAGYAAAFRHPEVIEAISSGPAKAVAVTLVEWSGVDEQRQVLDWAIIDDAQSAHLFASAVSEAPRVFSTWTSISGALAFSAGLFEVVGFVANRKAIDVSGDGMNNAGPSVDAARDDVVARGITINGLPILELDPNLDAYYRSNVIGGPGAFLIVARDISGFPEAVLQKLITEIADTGTEFAPIAEHGPHEFIASSWVDTPLP